MFKIFDKLGGIEPTLDVIQRRRNKHFRPKMRAVLSWQTTGVIPPVNTVLLMAECQERGIPFEWDDFRLPKKTEEKPKSFPRRKAGSKGP